MKLLQVAGGDGQREHHTLVGEPHRGGIAGAVHRSQQVRQYRAVDQGTEISITAAEVYTPLPDPRNRPALAPIPLAASFARPAAPLEPAAVHPHAHLGDTMATAASLR